MSFIPFFTGSAFSPLQYSPALWFDASDASTISESGGAVSQWDDKSGNGRDAVQASGGAQPTTNSVTIGGKNALSFDGADYLTIPDFSYTLTGQTIFVVAQTSLTTEQHLFTHYDTGGNQRGWTLFASSGSNLLAHGVSTDGTSGALVNVTSTPTTIGSNDRVLATRWAASDTDIYLDGTAATTGGAGAASMYNSTAALAIGARFIGGSAATFLTGKVGEVLLYDAALSDDDLAAVNSYLTSKWGI